MGNRERTLALLDEVLKETVHSWFERVTGNYVTLEESRQLGVEPEIKHFEESGVYRIKFARAGELDVTYGLSADEQGSVLCVESSVNNKSDGFDYDAFVERLRTYYWRSRNEKPWTRAPFDRFTYEDLMPFEPVLGESVQLDSRKDRADVIRLRFPLNPRHEELLVKNRELLKDLVENYCLHPLKRLYAESYRER